MKKVELPLNSSKVKQLRAGDKVLLSGEIYTARDAAHERMYEALCKGEKLPFDINNQTIYYVGPTPTKPGNVIGSAGPTTSGRMDKYTPLLLEHGLKGMIGKGYRDQAVKEAIQTNEAVYFGAIGGSAALLMKAIKSSKIIAYDDLGTEAIRLLKVEDFPAIVINDMYGDDLYAREVAKYKQSGAKDS